MDLQLVFENLVNLTEPICQVVDSSGRESWDTEYNPKLANKIIKQLKAYVEENNFNSNYNSYKVTYRSMLTPFELRF